MHKLLTLVVLGFLAFSGAAWSAETAQPSMDAALDDMDRAFLQALAPLSPGGLETSPLKDAIYLYPTCGYAECHALDGQICPYPGYARLCEKGDPEFCGSCYCGSDSTWVCYFD